MTANALVCRLAMLCAAGLWPLAATSAELVVAERGLSGYRIVIGDDAIASERHAAEELQAYVERSSGARLPIVRRGEASPDASAREVVLGAGAVPESLRGSIDVGSLGADGFLIRTAGDRLLVVGGLPRGTLNGVYTLIEQQLGGRWYTPEAEHVPRVERLAVGDLDQTRVPVFEQREVFWSQVMHNPDFAARQRLNGNSYALTEKHGGKAVSYYPIVHSLDALVPPELYEAHPEYFPLIDGKRKSGYVQRCLTNPEVVQLAIDRVRQWIKERPEATIISVSQNDTINNCQCPNCKAIDDAEGTPMGSMLTFVNAVAAAIETESPGVKIDTLAYQYTRKPPANLHPRQNVIIRLCSIECCFAHPLETCPSPENKRFVEDIKAWHAVAPQLYVWDYTTNFAHYQQPFPNFDALQANVKFLAAHGVKGLFEQGNYSPGGRGEMEPLRAYLLAKLLWDPETDLKRHTSEFLGGYYGLAAEPMGRFVELMQEQVWGRDVHAHIFDRTTAAYLNDEFLVAAGKLLDEAERRVADQPAVLERVRVARLPIQYVQIATGRLEGEAHTRLIEQFLEVARRAGITNISEQASLDSWSAKLRAGTEPSSAPRP